MNVIVVFDAHQVPGAGSPLINIVANGCLYEGKGNGDACIERLASELASAAGTCMWPPPIWWSSMWRLVKERFVYRPGAADRDQAES